jgi:hypothetical protein
LLSQTLRHVPQRRALTRSIDTFECDQACRWHLDRSCLDFELILSNLRSERGTWPGSVAKHWHRTARQSC